MPVNSFDNYPMSWKPDKKALKRPFYKSLASLLEQNITNGFLAPGTKLPPQRELADFLDLNFTTITRAYKICEVKGLIYAVTGSGTFVAA
jgi:DNA-binding transcriptional regulator YhcF (GntR family)